MKAQRNAFGVGHRIQENYTLLLPEANGLTEFVTIPSPSTF